ncbi:MAG: HepT-like ribonuclease domain-containing protein [Acidiferrobacter sp.]
MHGYFGVNHATVWETILTDLPDLQKQITDMVVAHSTSNI